MSFISTRQPIVTIRFHFVQVHYRKDSSWDRPRSLDMQISRSQLDDLRHQTLIDERNAKLYDWLTY